VNISSTNPALSTLRLSLTTEAQRETLLGKLSEGQTIQARVVDELSTGRWAIRFMGHTLVAESRLSLKPGQVVDTRVQDLGPPLTLSISGRPGSEAAAVRTALQQLGLPNDTTNQSIIASLIRNGLTVDRAEVQALRDFVSGLGEHALLDDLDELVDRILFLRSKGIPVTPDSVAAFWSSAPTGTMGALLEGLAELLRGLDKKTNHLPADRLTRLLETIPQSPDDLNPEDLRALLRSLGLDLEQTLSRSQPLDTLRTTLAQLANTAQLSPRDAEQVTDWLRFLKTAQASALPGDGADPITFQLPFVDGGRYASADIQINRGGEDGHVDPSRLTLSVTVTMSALGTVRVDLSSYEGRNTCGIRVDSPEGREYLASEIEALLESLKGAGYPVPEIKLQTLDGSRNQNDQPKPRIGVDFKA